ncbi:hypothetical protein C7C56_005380 [Massilia glaciei]|uniref:Uncharacterized protein n=2 Tax=Massilia glaciei TaxID=1524097 RepID=A0A2U2I4F7_9BURK|nr:hypothetical protein C7C56_005380 [Massilia glaciei]
MDHFLVWDTVSMAWTEVGLSSADYPKIALELRANYSTWEEVNEIIMGDVLGSFAVKSAFFPLALIPLIGMFLITPFPDWGYEKSYLQKRMMRWQRLPRWQHYLNPVRLVGYPIAYLFSLSLRHKLKAAYFSQTPTNAELGRSTL